MSQFDPMNAFDADILYQFEHDIKVEAVENIAIVALSVGCDRSLQLLKKLALYYTNQPEEFLVALSCRLCDLLRCTCADEPTEEAILAFLAAADGLSESCSHHVNSALCYSFNRVLYFYHGSLMPFCRFVQSLSQTLNTMQRSLAAQLIPMLYEAVDELGEEKLSMKESLGQIFGQLVEDEDALVRQQCAVSVSALVNQILRSSNCDKFVRSPTYIFACFDRLAQDLADLVRSENVGNGVLILKLICMIKDTIQDQQAREFKEVKEILPELIKAISRGSSDRYWRIRYRTAVIMPQFFQQIHKKLDVQDCAVMFKLLTEDCEPDIREISLENASQIVLYLDNNTIVNIFAPALLARAAEKEVSKVKMALSKAVCDVAGVICRGEALQDDVRDAVKATLEDIETRLTADADQEIKAAAIADIQYLYQYMPDFSIKLLRQLASRQEPKWRVRANLVKAVTVIVSTSGKDDDLVYQLAPMLIDDVFEVRKSAAEMISRTSLAIGVCWLTKGMSTKVLNMVKGATTNFENRISCAHCMVELLKTYIRYPVDVGLEELGKQICILCKDPNSYVRAEIVFNIRELYEYIIDEKIETMNPDIKQLLQDIFDITTMDEAENVRDEATELAEMLESFD